MFNFQPFRKDPWSLKTPSQPQTLDIIPHIIACKVTGTVNLQVIMGKHVLKNVSK